MALDYYLRIATDWSAAGVGRVVRETAESHGMIGSPNTLDGKGDTIALGMGIWVVASRPASEHSTSTMLGLAPSTVVVVFSVYKGGAWEDTEAQEDAMVGIVAGVLAAVPGDAFLDSDYEVLWLVRRGDDLSLHEDDRVWTPRRLAMITQPFRRATIQIP